MSATNIVMKRIGIGSVVVIASLASACSKTDEKPATDTATAPPVTTATATATATASAGAGAGAGAAASITPETADSVADALEKEIEADASAEDKL